MTAIGQLPPAVGASPRRRRMTTSISAPEASRIEVKLAASIAVSRSAMRHSRELLANASIASAVRRGTRRLVLGSVILYRYQGLNDHVHNAQVERGPPGPHHDS